MNAFPLILSVWDREGEDFDVFSKNLSTNVLCMCDYQELTYETASKLCHLSPRYFGSIARGQTTPSVNTLEKLCTGFRRSPNELLGFQTTDEELSYRKAMQVTHYRKCPFLRDSLTAYPVCPRCTGDIDREYQSFCEQCGQKLAWRNYSRATSVSAS